MQTRSFLFATAIAASVAGGALYFNAQSAGTGAQNIEKTIAPVAKPDPTVVDAPADPCPIAESAIIDGWKAGNDSTEYQQIVFELDDGKRLFSTWLHERPEIVGGSWSLDGCTLTLDAPYAAVVTQSYRLSMPNQDSLLLTPVAGSDYGSLQFTRVKTKAR